MPDDFANLAKSNKGFYGKKFDVCTDIKEHSYAEYTIVRGGA